jgi:hypothetical protein
MDQSSLTDVQRQQADALANAYQGDMDKESTLHRQDISHAYSVAHNALISLMQLLNQDEVERLQKSGKSIYAMDDREAQKLITEWIKKMREKAINGASTAERVEAMVSQIKALEKERDRLQKESIQQKAMILDLKQTVHGLRTQVATLEQTLGKVKDKEKDRTPQQTVVVQTVPPMNQGMAEPEWMADWRGKNTFERDSEILRIIGGTGFSRRPVIIQMAAKKLGKNPNNTSLVDALNRIGGEESEKGLHFIEKVEGFEKQGFDLGGALPIILRLTEKGRHAYWMLTGMNARECEFDELIKHHKSPEHTLLNLMVRDQLVNIGGYEILLDSPGLTLPDGEKFVPDIVALDTATTEVLYIEVERNTGKDEAYRIQKWRNLYSATHGKIYIYCDRSSFMKNKLIGEVNQALKDYHYSSYFSNYEDVFKGIRGLDGGIWIQKRD